MTTQHTSTKYEYPRTLLPPPLPYAAAIAGGWWLDRHVLPVNMDMDSIGLTLAWLCITLGLLLMLWAVYAFARHRTTINPYAAATRLCTSGPYRHSRNPIYVGDWLILAGCSLWMATIWPILLSPLVWAAIMHGVIRHEEAYLEARFGEEYRSYKGRVRRWI